MSSFSGLGIGLSFVFGCILMGLVAELYYLLWVRKRIPKNETEDQYNNNNNTPFATEFSHLFCWKKHSSVNNVSSDTVRNQEMNDHVHNQDQDLELGSSKDLLLKGYGEDSVESELMRLHNLCGPPRFLFTIKEETKEDLESEDGKSRCGDRSRTCSRNKSFSDLILTPLSSPPIKCQNLDSYNCQGFNPLFESSTENELNKFKSSPPPKFKFLRDAEEKLIRRLIELEAEKRVIKNEVCLTEEKGSFISFLGKSKMREPLQQIQVHQMNSTTCVKVLPLASSPSTYKPIDGEV
uniref:Putative ovule protein n=1 Tax=Solanum chacoense TaxID=4108 RepID=A0A0V0IAL1_SOLCH